MTSASVSFMCASNAAISLSEGTLARSLRARSSSALETRIISTADVFDALTADRPYRAAMPVSKAMRIMAEGLGTATDPDCYAAFARALNQVDAALVA